MTDTNTIDTQPNINIDDIKSKIENISSVNKTPEQERTIKTLQEYQSIITKLNYREEDIAKKKTGIETINAEICEKQNDLMKLNQDIENLNSDIEKLKKAYNEKKGTHGYKEFETIEAKIKKLDDFIQKHLAPTTQESDNVMSFPNLESFGKTFGFKYESQDNEYERVNGQLDKINEELENLNSSSKQIFEGLYSSKDEFDIKYDAVKPKPSSTTDKQD